MREIKLKNIVIIYRKILFLKKENIFVKKHKRHKKLENKSDEKFRE